MDRKVVPFRSWHREWIGDTVELSGFVLTPLMLQFLETQNSGTGIIDGEIIFCAGTAKQWAGRHLAWAWISKERGPKHALWIIRQLRERLSRVSGRVETSVQVNLQQGERWAELLGFRVETPRLEKYGPDGEDHIGYVRIN